MTTHGNWIDVRKLVVSRRGSERSGARIGVHVKALPDEPIAGGLTFRVELHETDNAGSSR